MLIGCKYVCTQLATIDHEKSVAASKGNNNEEMNCLYFAGEEPGYEAILCPYMQATEMITFPFWYRTEFL